MQLGIRARRYAREDPNKFRTQEQLGGLEQHVYTYVPGQPLAIPVEGGGMLLLRGQVADRRPKIAWGQPVEPARDQLVLTSPVVIAGQQVMADFSGGSTLAEGPEQAVQLTDPNLGRLTMALAAFPGAVRAQANWGRLEFHWNGQATRSIQDRR